MIYLFACVQTCACICICTRECSCVCRCAGPPACSYTEVKSGHWLSCSWSYKGLRDVRLVTWVLDLHSGPHDESHLSSPYTYPLHLKVVLPLQRHALLMISFLPLKFAVRLISLWSCTRAQGRCVCVCDLELELQIGSGGWWVAANRTTLNPGC